MRTGTTPSSFTWTASTLMQRTPVPWDENASGLVTGLDFITEPIAEHVTRFRVERIPQDGTAASSLISPLNSPVR